MGAPSPPENAPPRHDKRSRAARKQRTLAARAARHRSPSSVGSQDAAVSTGDSEAESTSSNLPRLKYTRRSVSPAASVASLTSEQSEYRPSSTGNRLLVSNKEPPIAQGDRPVHIPSLSNSLRPHLLCPGCRSQGKLAIHIDDEKSLGAAGVLNFRCSRCDDITSDGPARCNIQRLGYTSMDAPLAGRMGWNSCPGSRLSGGPRL